MILQTIEYYRNNGSNVYVLFLDCTKAFDKIKHNKMFDILVEKKVCPLILRIIKNMYTLNNSKIKWSNAQSEKFFIRNGVKQGGILSLKLFDIYLDSLLTELRNSKIGCHVGNVCFNSFAYADDIALLSPSLHGIKQLIQICEKYSLEYSIHFNPAKCALLYFNSELNHNYEHSNVFMFGEKLQIFDNFKHLRHSLSINKYFKN